jgi:AraC-like DNA-binding protein
MPVHISSPKYGVITLAPILAENIPGPLLPGSETAFCERDFGTIIIQEFNSEHYSLRYGIFNFFKKMTLIFRDKNFDLRTEIALRGGIKLRTGAGQDLNIKESEFTFFKSSDKDRTVFFDKGKEYRIFDTSYSAKLLEQVIESFPSLKDFIVNTLLNKKGSKFRQQSFASSKMIDIAYDILKCPHDESLRRLYFENKVNDQLFELIAQAYKKEPAVNGLTPLETSAVVKARDIILKDITQHFTVQEISRQVQLNRFKLKVGFKKMFGTGIFECLLQARMQEAKRLLTDTDKPIKKIASLTGYEYLTNFIIAFRKYYGYTPGSVRKK